MKGISKTAHAGLSPLIPAVLAPPEVLTQAALGFIPPPIKPTGARLETKELAPGIYGLLSLSVASRRRELAIRTAIGAAQSTIRNLVLAEGFRLIAGGVVAGLAAALVLSRVLQSFLFGVQATDPVTFILAGILFLFVALLAFAW